ncbi:MAG: DUF192 domain-containing protein, partial [Verrucomicrobia bacterium]|nr:DUF192 domain-containing protein [Verrucomicrobiota bacterium]
MISLLLTCALTLFHARTPEELTWGLMDQQELPPTHALLFHFPSSEQHTFWMFNCYQDLDLFLLDEEGVIVEKYFLKAYPEKLDKNRP